MLFAVAMIFVCPAAVVRAQDPPRDGPFPGVKQRRVAGPNELGPKPPKSSFIANAHGDFGGQPLRIFAVEFTADGNSFITASEFGSLRFWSLARRECMSEIRPGFSASRCFACARDGKTTYVAAYVDSPRNSGVRNPQTDIWCWGGGGSGRVLIHSGRISCLDVRPDGKRLAGADHSDTVYLWNAKNGEEVRRLVHVNDGKPGKHRIEGVRFAPDGKSLATWTAGRHVWIWDSETGEVIRRIDVGAGASNQLTFLPDGNRFLMLGYSPILFDSLTGKSSQFEQKTVGNVIKLHAATSLTISPDGKLVVSASNTSTICVWEVATMQDVEMLGLQAGQTQSCSAGVRPLAFSPRGGLVVVGCEDNSILLWEIDKRRPGDCNGATIPTEGADFARIWNDLLSEEASIGQCGVRELIADPKSAIRGLGEKLRPVPVPDHAATAKLIQQLGHPQQGERDRASSQLAGYREAVRGELTAASNEGDSPEVRSRCKRLLTQLDGPPRGERLRFIRAVQALETIASTDATNALERLAKGASGTMETNDAATALTRIKSRSPK